MPLKKAALAVAVLLLALASAQELPAQGLTITTPALPQAIVGVPYSFAVTGAGGTGAYSWSASGLPPGFSISLVLQDLKIAGLISGTAGAPGAFSVTVTLRDALSNVVNATFPLNIYLPLAITNTSLPAGIVGLPYSQTLTATGGTGTRTWSVPPGTLPPGLALSPAGVISGSPTTPGTYSFTVGVADGSAQAASAALSITVAPPLSIATASPLPSGVVGLAYSQLLAAANGAAPYTWSVPPGTLPPGLTLSPAGVISGSPTTAGTFNFNVTVADSSQTALKAFSLTINPALSITTGSPLPSGFAGLGYSHTLAAVNGAAPYRWSRISGSLPAGLALSAEGVISGTPSTPDTYTFTVRVTDNGGQTADKAFSITIEPPLTITTESPLPTGIAGLGYSLTLAAVNGATPYRWSRISGSLPPGMELYEEGVLSGTPPTPDTYTFTVRVSDSSGQTADKQFSITIAPPLTITTDSPLPSGIAGVAYSQTLAAVNGTTPYTWSRTSGPLPAGLSLSSEGLISGTPSNAGTSTFTVRVADSGGQAASKQFSITINPPLSITTASPLPSGTVGVEYFQALAAANGAPPYTWSRVSGSLPAGLALSSEGAISGTPTTADTFSFTVRVADTGGEAASKAISITINPAPLVITTDSPLSSGTVGTAYSQSLTAAGGTAPYTWSAPPGSLPAGLTLSAAGVISGTPTTAGNPSPFTVHLADSGGQSADKQFAITINPPGLSITTATLPAGTVGTPYSQSLTATGGTPPYAWSVPPGSLPAGLTLSAAGVITGTPTIAGTPPAFTVHVADSRSQTADKQLSLTINPPTLSITTASPLPSGTVGTAYSQSLTATGGTTPYTWSVPPGSLPAGLTLSPAGVISGTPTTAGTPAPFLVHVADSGSQTADKQLSITINPPGVISLSLTNVPGTANPAQQLPIALSLSAPQTNALSGSLTMTFTPNGAVATDNPGVQFSNGSRTANFAIPANTTAAVFQPSLLLLTSTVSGTVVLTATIQGGPAGVNVGSVVIPSIVPQLTAIAAARTSDGLRIQITGYSPERRVVSAEFGFDVRTTNGTQRVTLTRGVEPDFDTWFRGTGSPAFGSSFLFEQLFAVQGDATSIQSVTVKLTNGVGSSASSAPVPIPSN